MILLIAVLAGVFCGVIRARIGGRPYQAVEIKHLWLVFVAYLPQFLIFYFKPTRSIIPDNWVSYLLILSQILLLFFIWVNRKTPSGWLLGMGLLCNFLAIVLNGGLMPLTPENAQKLLPEGSNIVLEIGKRVGFGKDILLEKSATRLWFLGDIFTLPSWMNYPLAFSPGDVLVSLGAFWLFWEMGSVQRKTQEVLA
jgi:hypothetical protein